MPRDVSFSFGLVLDKHPDESLRKITKDFFFAILAKVYYYKLELYLNNGILKRRILYQML